MVTVINCPYCCVPCTCAASSVLCPTVNWACAWTFKAGFIQWILRNTAPDTWKDKSNTWQITWSTGQTVVTLKNNVTGATYTIAKTSWQCCQPNTFTQTVAGSAGCTCYGPSVLCTNGWPCQLILTIGGLRPLILTLSATDTWTDSTGQWQAKYDAGSQRVILSGPMNRTNGQTFFTLQGLWQCCGAPNLLVSAA